MTKIATFVISSSGPLCWSRYFGESKKDDEPGNEFEERTWKQKAHLREKTKGTEKTVAVPSLGLRDSIAEGGKTLSIGKGAARAKNLIKTAMRPLDAFFFTDKNEKDLRGEWRMLPSKPGSGSGNRVPKLMPMLDSWKLAGQFVLFDDRLNVELLTNAINKGGQLCGIGALRIQTGGVLGGYKLEKLTISDA